ncbi:AbrB/MazE/SpoVT family DNA-binding domain-containing protein [Sphingosinithalassobacter sp. LHW66-3]|uniref:AbrB/MazE/SpoVT family DNA-binding domain-containing protein n=1 Tax=Sphingosinithalassobacter sp. LHW66-3 TaxID=3424718 RepID=UPI003D6BB3E1
MGKQSRMTVKGQVTIPKDVRDALGLKPHEPVEFVWNEAGEAVIRKPATQPAEDFDATLQRFREKAAEWAGFFPEGIDSVEYVRELRGGEDPSLT